MNYKKIANIFSGPNPHWVGNGFRVKQYFPQGQSLDFYKEFSPFILLDYNEPYFFRPSPFPIGVGPHPHRGFETVTFSFAGKIAHGDNQGNYDVINPGDIQWMTAGSGILHKEYHEEEYAKKNRVFHMIQLWVDLPKENKMTAPNYQAIGQDKMGKYVSEDEGIDLTVYAGEAYGVKGPAQTFSPMNIYKLDIAENKSIDFIEERDFNTGILCLAGQVLVNEESPIKEGDFLLFDNLGEDIRIEGLSEFSQLFILSGRPLDQEVFAMGPFVMASEKDLIDAHVDFEEGAFGPMDF